HALHLQDSGVSVRVGLPATSRSRAKAQAAGLTVGDVGDVSKWADVVMILIPDTAQGKVYREEIEPNLAPGDLLLFAHGFNIRFGTITVRPDVDVAMVAPKSPGHRVRELFVEGAGTPALFAVHQDAPGKARQLTLSYANEAGRPTFNKLREADRNHPIEQVGARLRQMMPFLKPIAAEDTVGAAR